MKFSRRDLLAGAASVSLFANTDAHARFPHGSVVGSAPFSFKPIQIGGGGYCTGIDVSSDGLTILTRVDVFGAYIWNSSTGQHDLLTTTTRMPGIIDPGGCIEAVSAPSNSNIIFLWHDDGKLYRSTDHGVTFARIGAADFGAQDGGASNGQDSAIDYGARLFGKKMAIDPGNPDILYVATVSGGVFRSANATQSVPTFSVVASVPAPSNKNAFNVAFDPRVSQRTGGNSNICYIMSNGNGVYQMTAPAGAFTLMSQAGHPGGAAHMVVSPNGVLYVADGFSLYKWDGSAWTNYANSSGLNQTGISPVSVAVDPNNSSTATTERVIVCDGGGNLSVTITSGISGWSGILTNTLFSPEIPYLLTAGGGGSISTGDIGFDSVRNLIVLSEGFGDWTAPGATNANFVWTSQSKGIECCEPQAIVSTPNTTSTPTLTAWDLGAFYLPNPDTYSAVQIDTQTTSILGGWGIDWAKSDGGTLVYLITWQSVGPQGAPGNSGNRTYPFDASGISSDNGATLTPMPISTQSFSVNLTATGGAAGQKIITFGSTIPGWIGRGTAVRNLTHAGTVTGYVAAMTTTSITMDRVITGGGVINGDSIKVGLPGSGQVRSYQTSSATASGNVLHFGVGALPTDSVYPNMAAINISNSASLHAAAIVLSANIATGDVTLKAGSQLGAVAMGDVIIFADAAYGGSIAATSPTNFLVIPSDNGSFPHVTTDGGVTWSSVNIPGVPRAISATGTATSTTLVGDTTNLVIGGTFTDQSGDIFSTSNSNRTILSITDATHFVCDLAAVSSASAPLKTSGWGSAHTDNMKNCAADCVTAGKLYMYNNAIGFVYVSTDSGVTWAIANAGITFSGTISGASLITTGSPALVVGMRLSDVTGSPAIINVLGANSFTLNGSVPSVGPVSMTARVSLSSTYSIQNGQNFTLKSVPLNAGHLFLSGSNIHFQNTPLLRSTDGGATWSTVPTVSGVQCFGFGKPKVGGGGYPTIFMQGQVSGSFKLWQSDNGEQATPTWNFLGGGSGTANPLNSLDQIVDLDGDKNIAGKVYGANGFSGGWYYG